MFVLCLKGKLPAGLCLIIIGTEGNGYALSACVRWWWLPQELEGCKRRQRVPFDGNSRSMPTLWRRQALPWLLEAGITLRCVRIELRICRSGGRTGLFCNDCNVLSRRWLSLWFDAAYAPPWWVHLVTTLPLLIVLCALPLRPLKGWLVCSQYFYKAEEGRLAETNTFSDVDTGRPQARDPRRQERLSPSKLEGDGAVER